MQGFQPELLRWVYTLANPGEQAQRGQSSYPVKCCLILLPPGHLETPLRLPLVPLRREPRLVWTRLVSGGRYGVGTGHAPTV
jgi:hypothetical protein